MMSAVMRRRLYWAPVVLAMLSLGLLAGNAQAEAPVAQDPQAAETLFQQGSELFAKDDFERACPLFEKSYRLDTTKPGALHALAECYARWGKSASAVARYREYIEAVRQLPPERQASHEERVRGARAKIEELSPQLAELTLAMPNAAPPGTRVTLDGDELRAAALEKPLPVDPGKHRVMTQSPGEDVREQWVSLAKGEKKRLVLEVPRQTQAVTTSNGAQQHGSGSSGRRAGAYTAFAVGGASAVIGAVTGALVFARRSAIDEGCTAQLSVSVRGCRDQESLDAASSAKTLGTTSTILLPVGLVGLAIGTVLMLTEPSQKQQAGAGRWVAFSASSVGSGGGMVSAIGAF